MIEPSLLQVRGLSKTYQNRTGLFRRQAVEAIKPLSFDLEVGQTLAIVGEAGSGKSTLARILAGMIEPTSGDIAIDGQLMVHGDYQTRCKLLRMIFQDPNTSLNRKIRVGQILETPLRLNTEMTEEERREKVVQTLRMVGMLPDHALFYPQMLSSGQQQRVALARAIVAAPRVLLFDEPLSNLDSELRESLCGEMSRLLRQLGITAVYVTHDRREAELLADQIVYLSAGRVAAVRAVTPTSGEVA